MEIGKKAIRNFGKRVQTIRKHKRLSQEELAFEIDVDRSYISSLERGLRNPTLKTISRLAAALKITISELCQGI